MKFKGKIYFTMDENHPDKDYVVGGWSEGKEFDFDDIYTFDERYGWDKESAIEHIKRDLKLVAGGGYDYKHIHNVRFEINEV